MIQTHTTFCPAHIFYEGKIGKHNKRIKARDTNSSLFLINLDFLTYLK